MLSSASALRLCQRGALPTVTRALVTSSAKNDTLISRRVNNINKVITAHSGATPHDHSFHFKFERYWAAGMVPLLPTAYFVHNPVMDYALAVAIGMHIHWGLGAVLQDYARPFLLGETLAGIAQKAIYLFTALLLSGLMMFNYNDVGITKAFEMIWKL